MKHLYLYRVLRPDEDHTKGLNAAFPESSLSVCDHVAYGSRRKSKYISTCADLSKAMNFARLGMQRRGVSKKTIVTIDVDKLRSVPGVQIIDLTDPFTLMIHCGTNSRAISFAQDWNEVIVVGAIPAHCITSVKEVSSLFSIF